MKKSIALILSLVLLLAMAMPAFAEGEDSFVLAAVSANSVIIEPVRIAYTSGQSVKDALLASDHSFVGLEQGFIYEVDGVSANFTLFYDGNGFDLGADAAEITVLCIGVSSQYSEELLDLILRMAEYREMGSVQQYPAAQEAYTAALRAVRNGDALTAQTALAGLNDAIEAYESLLSGEKYTLTVAAMQGETTVSAPFVTLTDVYGNVTRSEEGSVEVVAGTYTFSVSDGGYNRTEGTVEITGDTSLSVMLPHGEWFGAVKILDASKEAYPCTQNTEDHTAVYQIPDTAKELSSLYLNVEQGDVPSAENTKLRTVYTGTNGVDYANTSRSWESSATALTYLVTPGMEGTEFPLEARYTDENGHLQIQSYEMRIERTPTLSALSVTAEGTVLPMAFDPLTCSYEVVTVSDSLMIEATGFGEDYTVEGAGTAEASESHTVTVSSGGKSTVYTLRVTKKDAVSVMLSIPENVTVSVENSAGSVIAPVSGAYRLIPGESYTYRATAEEHYHTADTFTASEGLNISVAAPVTEDWLTALAVYNGSNAGTRTAYTADSAFSAGDHSYIYTVSDCNTTAYVQATSVYTVEAHWRTQTTYVSTNGVEKAVIVDKAVDTAGAAKILTQVIAKSGFSNTVLLRVSNAENGVTYYQDYTVMLARKLHLTEMSVSGAEGELTLLDTEGAVCSFDRDRLVYQVSVNRDEEALYLTGAFPNPSGDTDCCGGYYAMLEGERKDTLEDVRIPLDPAQNRENVTLEVCHGDSGAVSTVYTLTVQKTDPVDITFATTPEDAVVYLVNDQNGRRIFGEEGVYALTPGGSYSYTVTCVGYCGVSDSYIVPGEDSTVSIALEAAEENTELQQLESYWPHLRQNSDNNGVIDAPVPVAAEDAVLYWATKIGDGYDKNACGCPILVDGYLYTYAGTTIYKVDTVSGEIVATGEMDHASSYAINPPTYAEGMLFIGLADGCVQAFNAATLESLWIYRDPLGGQPNNSVIYHDGYVYTGFWVGETSTANYVCLTATDEDPSRTKEEKLAVWKYCGIGGFYWAGAYVCEDYLLVGTDDGASGYTSGYAKLLSFDPKSGRLLDEYTMGVVGDIRSSIAAYDGKYYFTNKGGYFFEAEVLADGSIESIRTLRLYNYSADSSTPPMSTCTPTIWNGRAYVGVSGVNQFGAYSGHNITVIDIPNWEIAYTVRTQGYPQTSGVLTTAYGDEGCVYVYFFDNYTPGKLRILKDKPGQTAASLVSVESYTDKGITNIYETALSLFTPYGDQAQYAICSPIIDENGTIYFKNDSAYLMAVGSTIEELEITQEPEKLTYRVGEVFDSTGLQVTARYTNGTVRDVTDYVVWSEEPLTVNDTDFTIQLPHVLYQNGSDGTAGVEYPKPFAALQLTVEAAAADGDVNGDGNVDNADVSLLLQYINGIPLPETAQAAAADVNGDGNVDNADVSLILRYINGVITAFPGETEA